MWVVYGLIWMIWFGLSSAIGKTISREVWSANSVFLRNLFWIPLIIACLFLLPWEQYTLTQCLKIMLLWLVWYIPLVSFLKSLQYWDVWILWPMSNASKVVTILLWILLLWESVTTLQTLSIVLIIWWWMLLWLDITNSWKWISTKALIYILIAVFWRWVVFFMFKISTDATWPVITALFVEFWVWIWSIIHSFFLKQKLWLQWKSTKFIRLAIAFWVLGNIWGIAINYGYTVAPVSIITAVFACSTLVTSLYWVLVYKEKLWIKERMSIVAIIVWLIILSWIIG